MTRLKYLIANLRIEAGSSFWGHFSFIVEAELPAAAFGLGLTGEAPVRENTLSPPRRAGICSDEELAGDSGLHYPVDLRGAGLIPKELACFAQAFVLGLESLAEVAL